VLRGRDEDATLHEAGGVTHLGDVRAVGFEEEAIEISAAKNNAGP
jgi:hypothetical protein